MGSVGLAPCSIDAGAGHSRILDERPKHESFHQADMLMQRLANLSPRRLQKLLTECRSVKVKRLFFFFADRHQPAWLSFISLLHFGQVMVGSIILCLCPSVPFLYLTCLNW
ncbi:type IV toxin-antitoxin system AbiEi family antitoxin domain-containing protein [Bradyrhizobium huanghuaihaiense]|uniref:type IV toxin-antitoxin system AbiEi family antitoxin domain-containing protein n=1 Tax=Bradyrhizobium huanghuaihaiense TaxID=990078 RepID=UPI0021AA7A71|nr:type IV toxin-antitoxin system AbiEi family antitoxin domain-containing protein [Bradyrhizobium sp. CB3035]UWU78308.1 type IV toxin-antitoxin system AbiEi family antitoxin domain-containing protein [Bradyrhizobium sp. CB3035]